MASSADEMFQRAMSAMQTGMPDAAEALFKQILQLQPGHLPALDVYSILLAQQGRRDEAERYARRVLTAYDEVLRQKPHLPEPWLGRAHVQSRLGRRVEAIESCDRAIAARADLAPAHLLRAKLLADLRRHAEALAGVDKLLTLSPSLAEAWLGRGNIFFELNRYDEALAACERALALKPGLAEAWLGRGNALDKLKREDESLAAYDRSLALNPHLAGAWLGRGNVLNEDKRYGEALAAYDRALAAAPDIAEAWLGRANGLFGLKRYDEASATYDRALALKVDLTEGWLGRGHVFDRLKRHGQAADAYAQALKIEPQYPFAKGMVLHQKMLACDWRGIDDLVRDIDNDVAAGKLSAEPFGWQAAATSPRSLHRCTQLYNAELYPANFASLPPLFRHDKIRIGYSSGELRKQATSLLMVGVFERHDKSRFEVYGVDNGWDDGSEIRRRINTAMHGIIDIRDLNDASAAAAIRDREIDILVNLNGYFGEHRTAMFARRPAPVQVNYLGFPGTLGATYMDYIIADRHVIPEEHKTFYAEKVVYLPNCYQANDSEKKIGVNSPGRHDCGLPESGFVFCCFNNTYKITPEIFDSWMRILSSVGDSVLWLLEENAGASINLRKEAAVRKVNPQRLVFAKRVAPADHLARHRFADLFLDTLPYNAHTTASDALWAGLPLLTCRGGTFPGRVAASLLDAIGLPELVTASLDAYEQAAVGLAMHSEELAAIKGKLAANRLTAPLFDTALFTRHIEAAYTGMVERRRAGLPPGHFDVPN